MDTIGNPVEDDAHGPCVVNRTWTLWQKIAWRKLLPKSPEAFKKERDTWGETQEECVFPGNKENSRCLHERKQLRLCYTEQIQLIKITDIELSWRNWSSWNWRICWNSRYSWRTCTWLNFRPNRDQSVQIKKKPAKQPNYITNQLTNPTAQTQTTPPKTKSPAKFNSHRFPIRSPSSKLNNPNLKLNCVKH